MVGCSSRSLETLVKMGGRLGCHPKSAHLHTPSMDAQAIDELTKQTEHLAPIHEAMDGLQMSPKGPKGIPPPPTTPQPMLSVNTRACAPGLCD